jgi:short-subunit dehydrogenase
MAQDLTGKLVAITGAARGIGEQSARVFAERGAKVAIGDLDLDAASATAGRLDGAASGEVAGFALDVTDPDSFAAFLAAAEKRFGRPVDVLVNNAGIMPTGNFLDEDPDVTRRLVDINLTAIFTGARLVLPAMLERDSGTIVNVASLYGKVGGAGAATYCGTKHAVVGFSESLRAELAGTGVDVVIVMPSLVRTDLTAGVSDTRIVPTQTPEQVADALVAGVERGRTDVFVPWYTGVLNAVGNLLPRVLRDRVVASFGTHEIMTNADASSRAAYLKGVLTRSKQPTG